MLEFFVKGILRVQALMSRLYISSVHGPCGSSHVPGTGRREEPSLPAELLNPGCMMMPECLSFSGGSAAAVAV